MKKPPTPGIDAALLSPLRLEKRTSRGLGEVVEALRSVRAARLRTSESLQDQLRAARRMPPYPPPIPAEHLSRSLPAPRGQAAPRPAGAADEPAPPDSD